MFFIQVLMYIYTSYIYIYIIYTYMYIIYIHIHTYIIYIYIHHTYIYIYSYSEPVHSGGQAMCSMAQYSAVGNKMDHKL